MPESLNNLTIAITEHRRERELKTLIEHYGATVVSCPLLEEVPVANRTKLQEFVRFIVDGQLDMIVFFTGVGVSFIVKEAQAMGVMTLFIDALKEAKLVARGPKPIKALRELKLKPDLVPKIPTSEGLLELLDSSLLLGRSVGVQLYGSPNREFCSEIERRGANLQTVQVYNYGPVSDQVRVVEFIDGLVSGVADVVAFTSAPQVRSLFHSAKVNGLTDGLMASLNGQLKIAAVGEVTMRAINELGLDVAILPDNPRMGSLAKAIADHFETDKG